MDMKTYLNSSTIEDRQQLAELSGTTVAYFWQIAGGHRKPGALMCVTLEKNSNGKIKAKDLRPDYFK